MADNFIAGGVTFGSRERSGAQIQQVLSADVFGTATITSVVANLASVQLIAANAARQDVYVYNDSVSRLRIKFGTGASASSLTAIIEPKGLYEMPPKKFSGVIHGIWEALSDGSVDPTGAARITELTE